MQGRGEGGNYPHLLKGGAMRSRKQRRLDREKLERRIRAMSRLIGLRFDKLLKDAKCQICGEKASGTGDGVLYCQKHFWTKFDEKYGE